MNEAGGAADWVNNNPMFALTNQGGGLWTRNVVISTAGTYQYKATANGWANQWGTNGHNNDAATFAFTTTAPNQAVRLLLGHQQRRNFSDYCSGAGDGDIAGTWQLSGVGDVPTSVNK